MINNNDFLKQTFETHGVRGTIKEYGVGRVPAGWKPGNTASIDLREKIRDLMWDKAEEYRSKKQEKISDFAFIEKYCRIPMDTMKKAINGRYKVTRKFLAKLSVGLKLDLLEANELFGMHSGQLNLTNDFDFIVFHALKTRDEIDFFINEVYQHLNINLDVDR